MKTLNEVALFLQGLKEKGVVSLDTKELGLHIKVTYTYHSRAMDLKCVTREEEFNGARITKTYWIGNPLALRIAEDLI